MSSYGRNSSCLEAGRLSDKKRKKETVLSEKFTEVSEYISQHYQEDLSVAELAEKFHMSYSYFAAIFKEYYGQTCKEMILTVRLQKAEDLLQFTDFDLTYISQRLDFVTAAILSRRLNRSME